MKKYVLLIYVLAISCEQIVTNNNSESDTAVSKEIAKDFYEDLMKLDTLKIYDYLDVAISKKQMSDEINRKFKDYGNVKSFEVISTETTNTVRDSFSQINYRVSVLVGYEKGQCIEKLGFKKINNDVPRLEGYSFKEVLK